MKTRKLVILVVLAFVSLAPCLAFAGEFDLPAIQQAIAEKGLHWTAGPAPFTDAEFRAKLGAHTPILRDSLSYSAPLPPAPPLPASWDWRDHNGVTPIRDQGACGSCWAFSAVGALESAALIQGSYPQTLDLSEQGLVSCDSFDASGCEGGGLSESAAGYLVQQGTVDAGCFPYESFPGNDYPCDPCSNWQQHLYKAGGYASVAYDVDAIKQAVYQGPVITTMEVFDDFMNYQSGVYAYAYGQDEGGHSILIVGYDDAGQYFIVKNSWGAAWGMNGFFEIAYSEAGYDSATGFGGDSVSLTFGSGPADDDDNDNDDSSGSRENEPAAENGDDPSAGLSPRGGLSPRSTGFGC